MKRLILICLHLFCLMTLVKSQGEIRFDFEEEDETKCRSLTWMEDEQEAEAPGPIRPFLNCGANIAQSWEVNRRYIAWVDFPQIKMYDQKTGKVSQLMSVFEDSEGVSELQWESEGDGDNATELVFVNINRKRYAKGSKIFLLSIEDGALKDKKSEELPAMIECDGDRCDVSGVTFYDGLIEYYTGDREDLRIGLTVRWFRFQEGDENDWQVVNTGMTGPWAMAETFFYELQSGDGKPIPLPEAVKQDFMNSGKAWVSPRKNFLVYLGVYRIMMYEFKTKKIRELERPFDEADGMSEVIWDAQESRMAFMGNNSLKYEMGSKLFVFDFTDKNEVHKQTYDVPARQPMQEFEFVDRHTIRYSPDINKARELKWECENMYDGCEIHVD